MSGAGHSARVVAMALSVLLASAVATASHAGEEPTVELFEVGTEALRQGRYQEAIDRLEAFADRAPSHPDASYNRGLAYLMRVRNGDEKPGDLGRAAAAFEEASTMRPGDESAREALRRVHGEVARRRSRQGEDSLLARPTLDRIVVGLASERSWGYAAIVSAALLALGMVLRQRREGPLHLAGTLLLPASAALVLAFVPLYLAARELRLTTESAVVVVREAHFTDEGGKALGGEAIPEAARIEVGERKGPLVFVRYGSSEGWVQQSAIRMLRIR